jgi:hypothetical protein
MKRTFLRLESVQRGQPVWIDPEQVAAYAVSNDPGADDQSTYVLMKCGSEFDVWGSAEGFAELMAIKAWETNQ